MNRLFRRNPKRLPGTLCDETPVLDLKPAIGNWGRDDDAIQQLVADGPTDVDPRPVDVTDMLVGPTPLADELRRDRELLEAANARLVARLRHRTQLLAQFLSPEAIAELERADAVAARPRPFGHGAALAIADDELLVRPLPGAHHR